MEKIYRLLDWLDIAQAVDWLQDMTNTRVNATSLLQLCDAGQCLVYLDCRGAAGDVSIDIGEDEPMYVPANGAGICKVEYPLQLGNEFRHGTHVIGLVRMKSTGKLIKNCELWIPVENNVRAPLFKPTDIEALAAKMNGDPSPLSSAELNELEQERAARVSAEAQVVELRNELGKRTLSDMRAMCDDDLELRAMTERAAAAERMVAALDRQATELSERQARDGKIIAKMAERIGQYQKGLPQEPQPEIPATGLTFPYATKHLEAMRDAALEHWSEHDRSKPAPYGIQKTVQNFLAERTGENARKLAELAAAIKPDDLPKL